MGEPEVVRWYTRGFRVPRLIGKLHDGTHIPGGPYTVPALAAAFVVGWIGNKTMPLWGPFGNILDMVPLAIAVGVTAWAASKIPLGGRSPASVARGLGSAFLAPATGRHVGRALRPRSTARITGRCMISRSPDEVAAARAEWTAQSDGPTDGVGDEPVPEAEPEHDGSPIQTPPPQRRRVVAPSGVQAVLAASAARQAGRG